MDVTQTVKNNAKKIMELKFAWSVASGNKDSTGMTNAANAAKSIYDLLPVNVATVLKASDYAAALLYYNTLIVPAPVIAPVSISTTRTLRKGSSGEDVGYLQQKLNQFGFSVGSVDGIFGNLTESALIKYQKSRGLVQDGVCGILTWNALNSGQLDVEVQEKIIHEAGNVPKGVIRNWTYIIIHHTAAEEKDTEQIRQYHLSKGWIDIGYNYVIEKSGKIVEGRSLLIPGAHCNNDGMNDRGIGIAAIGNFNLHVISQVEYNSLLLIIRQVMAEFGIPVKNVLGHKEVEGAITDCPGKFIDMNTVRSDIEYAVTLPLATATEEYVETYNLTEINELSPEESFKGIHNTLTAGTITLLGM